ncbi:MAG: hypothetical protein GXO43_02745 [Crenarchaeota archaeon]|nr:hypothetical protein [Thermoproteota archaeon]
MGQKNNEDIQKIFGEIGESDEALRELEEKLENENLAALVRRKFFEKKLGISLSATGSSILDFVDTEGKISYRPVGAIQVPVTIIGPIELEGETVQGEKYVPLSSIYPALMETMDLGVTICRNTKISIKTDKCWIRLFNISKDEKCEEIESIIKSRKKKLHILCYGRESGGIVETILVGESSPCQAIKSMIISGDINELVKTIGETRVPILAPYITLDYKLSVFIPRLTISSAGIGQSEIVKTYNAIENMRGIDDSIIPVTLGVLTSFYLSIGIKPEYALRSEIRRYFLVSGFRGLKLGLDIRVALPYTVSEAEQTIMNRELYSVINGGKINPLVVGELASSLALISYIGELAMIAKGFS